MSDIDGHLPADDIREIKRNERRDRKRTTKMVVDNAGIKRLRTQRRAIIATEAAETVRSEGA